MFNKIKSAFGRKTIIILFLIAATIESNSQIIEDGTYVQHVWSREYNGSGDNRDYIRAMVVDDAGNVYVTGATMETGGNENITTIKYNSAGVRQWVRKYGGINNRSWARSIAIDGDGNVYVTGESAGSGTDYDFITIKYSAAGVEQWLKSYNGTGNGADFAHSIAVDEDGNVYITGNSPNSLGNTDCVTIKYTSYGNAVWVKRYNGTENLTDMTSSIAMGPDGSLYIAGWTKRTEMDSDYLLIKYNSSGTEQWVRTYDGLGNGMDFIVKMVIGNDNNIYVTGSSEGNGTGLDYVTLKYNSGGILQWIRRYNGPANKEDQSKSLAVDDMGNIYVTGYSMSNVTSFDYATIKYNSAGSLQWVKREDGGNNYIDYARDIALDESGNVYVTGDFKKTETDYQLVTIKYSPSGVQKWLKLHYTPTDKVTGGFHVAADGSGNIYVGGWIDVSGASSGNYANYLVVKYTQSRYVIINRNGVPAEFSLSQNYPNPFNPVTKISFSIPTNSYTKLVVYDISGKQVAELVDNELEAGNYNIDFDASHLSSGIYLYRIEAGGFTETRKMMLVK